MIPSGDPYRTLGLPPGAPLPEVKRAYRRLAKQLHPDTAGPAALPRFLAVKAAYEMLVGPSRGRAGARWAGRAAGPAPPPGASGASGPSGSAGPSGSSAGPRGTGQRSQGSGGAGARGRPGAGPAGAPPGSAWGGRPGAASSPGRGASGTAPDDDPFAWARRGRRPSDGGGRTGSPGRAGAGREERGGASSGGGPKASRSTGAGPGPRPRRPTRRATLGSTSYDDALHEEERAWHGAAWYGVTTGTYWRPNPREYADPRKHGPEYEARARRAAAGLGDDRGAAEASADPGAFGGASAGGASAARGCRDGAAPVPQGSPEPAPRGPSAADRAMPGRPARGARTSGPSALGAPGSAAEAGAAPLPERLAALLLATPTRARLTFAVAGWPFLALLVLGAAGELSGCGRYAAGCPVDADTWTLFGRLAAAGLFGLLLALPRLALRAAIAGSVALAVAAPGAALLAVFGGSRDPAGASGALTLVVALAWSVGAVGAASGRLRLPPALRARVPWWS